MPNVPCTRIDEQPSVGVHRAVRDLGRRDNLQEAAVGGGGHELPEGLQAVPGPVERPGGHVDVQAAAGAAGLVDGQSVGLVRAQVQVEALCADLDADADPREVSLLVFLRAPGLINNRGLLFITLLVLTM